MSRWKTVENRKTLRKVLAAGLLLWLAASGAPAWAEDPESPPPPSTTDDGGPVDRDTDILTFTGGDTETAEPAASEPQAATSAAAPHRLIERWPRAFAGRWPWAAGAAGTRGADRGLERGAHLQSP